MTQQAETDSPQPVLPALKIPEPEVNAEKPWADDVLEREEIAKRLTSIVRGQEAPFVISVDGRWGTGKTFLLKRWAQDLRNQDPPWQAIYYNAWEDDFANDPLVAIVGQLSEHFARGRFAQTVEKLGGVIPPLLRFGGSLASLMTIGLPLPSLGEGNQAPPDDVASYLEKRAAKDELKTCLKELAAEVRDATGQPLVFIIDELDRCRPTFAIELLERVKHIFDVPNIVFVFGINREELTKSLESVYGEIDAGTYLRRFFDMEFVLPDPDPAHFCTHLAHRHRLALPFNAPGGRPGLHGRSEEYSVMLHTLPVVLRDMAFSLRDMEYCVRLLALAARDLEQRRSLYPSLLVPLVALKIRNPDLYRRFVNRDARGAEVIDYVNELRADARAVPWHSEGNAPTALASVEAALYCADDADRAFAQLGHLRNGISLTPPLFVSKQTASIVGKDVPGSGYVEALHTQMIRLRDRDDSYGYGRWSLAQAIDIYYGMTSR